MKAVIFPMLATACFAYSSDIAAAQDSNNPDDTCGAISLLSERVMQLRQAETDLLLVMQTVADPIEGPAKDVVKQIILDAYSKPAYSTESNKQRAVAEFKNDMTLACLTAGL